MSVHRRGVLASQKPHFAIVGTALAPPPPSSTLPNVPSGTLIPTVALMGPGASVSAEFPSQFSSGAPFGGLDLKTWVPYFYQNGFVQNSDTASNPSLTQVKADGLHLTYSTSAYSGVGGSGARSCGTIMSAKAATPGQGYTNPGYTGFTYGPPTGSNGIYTEFSASLYNNGSQLLDWQTLWIVADPAGTGFTSWPGCGEWDIMETNLVTTGDPGWTVISGHYTSGPFSGATNNGPGGTAVTTTSPMLSGAITWGQLWTTSKVTTFYNGIDVSAGGQLITNPGYNNWGVGGYTGTLMAPAAFPSHLLGGTPGSGVNSTGGDMILKYVRVWSGALSAHP